MKRFRFYRLKKALRNTFTFKHIRNLILMLRFPFLIPRNRWTDKKSKFWFWSDFTELDAMPYGWRKVFGVKMCKEIKKELKKVNYLHKYRITQIKEKYGTLRWYDFGAPQSVSDIIRHYEDLSMCYCIQCGKPVRYATRGWVAYLCEDCAKSIIKEEHLEDCRVTLEDIPNHWLFKNGEKIELKTNIDFIKMWGLKDE